MSLEGRFALKPICCREVSPGEVAIVPPFRFKTTLPLSKRPSRKGRVDTSSNPMQAMNWRAPLRPLLVADTICHLPHEAL